MAERNPDMSTPDAARLTSQTDASGPAGAAALVRQYPAPAVLLAADGQVQATSLSGAPLVSAILQDNQVTDVGRTILAGAADGRSHTIRCRTMPDRVGDPAMLLDLTVLPTAENGAAAPGIVILSKDVTAEQAFLDALMHSRHLFRDLVQASGAFYWEVNALGNFTLVPERGAFGYSAELLEGGSCDIFALHRQEIINLRSHFMTRNIIEGQDIWIRSADGSSACIQASASPSYDAQGRWIGAHGIARDVTAERTHARELRLAGRRADLMASVAEALYGTEPGEPPLAVMAEAVGRECEAEAAWCFQLGVRAGRDGSLDEALAGAWGGKICPRISELLSAVPALDQNAATPWRTGSYLCLLCRTEGRDVLLLVLQEPARDSETLLQHALTPLIRNIEHVLQSREAARHTADVGGAA